MERSSSRSSSSYSSRGSAERTESKKGSEEERKSSLSENSDRENSSSCKQNKTITYESKSSHCLNKNKTSNQSEERKYYQHSYENIEQLNQNNSIKNNDQNMKVSQKINVRILFSSIFDL